MSEFEKDYYGLEETHWWSRARREILFLLLEDSERSASILEVGCSSGVFLDLLKRRGYDNVQGIDISHDAVALCRNKGFQNVQRVDGVQTGFRDGQFDWIVASDVLEHIPNDQEALSEWHRILKAGGRLIVFVPAFRFLWSSHDRWNRHHRRYAKKDLRRLVSQNHFRSFRFSYWNISLFAPLAAYRLFQRLRPLKPSEAEGMSPDQQMGVGSFWGGLLRRILEAENRLLKMGINFPIGVSLFCVAEK